MSWGYSNVNNAWPRGISYDFYTFYVFHLLLGLGNDGIIMYSA